MFLFHSLFRFVLKCKELYFYNEKYYFICILRLKVWVTCWLFIYKAYQYILLIKNPFQLKKRSFTNTYFCVSAVNVMHRFSLRDVQALGVNLLGHQRKIVNAAKQLRTHLTQGHVEV